MDNFFAEQESKRFAWIYISFYAALTIGVMALFVTLFFSVVIGIIFSLFIIGFYSYYGVQFINYAYLFQNIEAAIIEKEEIEGAYNNISTVRDYTLLEINIEEWLANKIFIEQGINIEKVALQLNTNRTYLSGYVNNILNKTFKEWISELRLNEAKSLLLKHPELSISDISEMAGFSDKSNFGRLFIKQMEMTPKAWRISNLHFDLQTS